MLLQEGESEEIQMKLDNLIKEEKSRANRIKNTETTIEKLHREMQREVKVEDDATVNEEMVSSSWIVQFSLTRCLLAATSKGATNCS